MRVRVIRCTHPLSSAANLRVERWCVGQWEPVINFELNQSEPANEFALKLSLTKRVPVEMAVFEDGEKLEQRMLCSERVESGPPELAYRGQKSESSP